MYIPSYPATALNEDEEQGDGHTRSNPHKHHKVGYNEATQDR